MKKKFVVAALITGSHVFAPHIAFSQDTASLDEVVVSANKFPIKSSLTGKVVTIISRKDIEHSGSRDLSQVLSEQGGIYINGANSNPGKDKSIYIRGGRVEHTLITIDGVPVYDASGIGSNFDIRNISIDAVERIEILKGSQGTLFGSDAIAGVINIITRKGGTKPVAVYGSASAGSFNTLRTSAGISGKKDRFDYNLAYSTFTTAGISEALKPDSVRKSFERDGYKQQNIEASFGVQAGKGFRLQPFFRFTKNTGDLDQQGYTDETDYTYKAENLQTGVRNDITVGRGKLNVLYSFNKTRRSYLDDSTGTRNGFYSYSTSRYKTAEHFAEAFLVYPFQGFTVTGGTDVRSSHTDQTSLTNFGSGKTLAADSARQKQLAFYAAINIDAGKGLSIDGGLRYNNHSAYGGNLAYNVNPSFRIKDRWKLFANISSGYKTPSLYQLYSQYGNKELNPETSVHVEGGVQYFSADRRANIRALYFDRKVKDAIAFFFDPVTFASFYINQDRQKDHGIELETQFAPNERLQLKAFYTYTTGKVTTKNRGKDTVYFNLFRRPQHVFTLQAGSQFTKKLFASANLQAVNNTRDITFDASFRQVELKLKNYVLLSLYGEFALVPDRLKVFADIRNVGNERFEAIYGYSSPRLNAYGGLRFNL